MNSASTTHGHHDVWQPTGITVYAMGNTDDTNGMNDTYGMNDTDGMLDYRV